MKTVIRAFSERLDCTDTDTDTDTDRQGRE